jgi:hypothetical protein
VSVAAKADKAGKYPAVQSAGTELKTLLPADQVGNVDVIVGNVKKVSVDGQTLPPAEQKRQDDAALALRKWYNATCVG